MGAKGMVFERGCMNVCHKARNGWYLGLVGQCVTHIIHSHTIYTHKATLHHYICLEIIKHVDYITKYYSNATVSSGLIYWIQLKMILAWNICFALHCTVRI